MNTTDLQYELTQFHGTEKWRRHPLNPRVLHTDGVEHFAYAAGAYWFIDAIALGVYGRTGPVPQAIPNKDSFGVVLLKSAGGKGSIEVRSDYDEDDDSCGERLWYEDLEFTDCPEGAWRFYLIDDGEHTVLLVPSEY